jgi:Protein of unknown function/Domain of unknown function (DUF1835)
MIHIVFQQNDIDTLKKAIDLDTLLVGNVLQVADDFAAGPLKDIYTREGIAARRNWWREILSGGDYDGIVDDGSVTDDNKLVHDLREKLQLEKGEIIWIWVAPNQHDVSGYYWLVSQLKDLYGQVYILNLGNLPFINEKGHIFYPDNLFNIPAREFVKAKKLARPVSLSEFEIDPDEWTRLCNENKGIRTFDGGKKLSQHDYDHYDADLKKMITGDWQKVNKLLHAFYSKNRHTTGDAYLLWRLKLMIAGGSIDVQGEIKGMKDFEVKLKSE